MVPEAQQGGHVVVGHQPDVAAVAPVPTVGTAPGDVRLPPERDRPGSAVAGLHMDLRLVDEARHRLPRTVRVAPAPRPGRPERVQASSASTSTRRRPLRAPNFTLPAAVAKRVSSLPRLTLSPGWKWVPRWRTMIPPG